MRTSAKSGAIAYALGAISYASIYTHPVVSEGVGNISTFIAWSSVASVAMLLTASLFVSLDKWKEGDPAPCILKWAFRLASYGAVVWLAYHGAFIMAAIMAYNVIISAILRASFRAHKEAP